MPVNPSTLPNDQSIKLSVTVKARLEAKYTNPAALKKIKAISGQGLKKKMLEIEKVKEAYMQYLQGR